MRSSMSCHSCPGPRALYVSTNSSVFTCTLIEATVTPASCQQPSRLLPASTKKSDFLDRAVSAAAIGGCLCSYRFQRVLSRSPSARYPNPHKIFLLLNHQEDITNTLAKSAERQQ